MNREKHESTIKWTFRSISMDSAKNQECAITVKEEHRLERIPQDGKCTKQRFFCNGNLVNEEILPFSVDAFQDASVEYSRTYSSQSTEAIEYNFKSALSCFGQEFKKEFGISRLRLRYRNDYRKHVFTRCKTYIEQDYLWDVFGLTVEFSAYLNHFFLLSIENVLKSINQDTAIQLLSTKLRQVKSFVGSPTIQAGRYKVVMGPQAATVFWHECIGHMLEADFVSQRNRVMYGQLTTNSELNVIDNTTNNDDGGVCYKYDDEGVQKKEIYLIRNGNVESVLTDKLYAEKCKLPLTGNGRYGTGHIRPRMSNIMVKTGKGSTKDWLNEPHLYVNVPRKGFFDGEKINIDFEGGYLASSVSRNAFGPFRITLTPYEALACLEDIAVDNEWQSSGGLCNKANSNGVITGASSPSILFDGLWCIPL